MKSFLRIAALMMVLVFAVGALAACGESGNSGDNGGGNQAASVKGTTQEWGNFKVLVPDGYTLKGGNLLDENDPEKFNINNNDNALTYYMFGTYDEEGAKDSIDMTKESNEGAKDVSATYNGVEWTGVAYESIGYQCFELSGKFGDKYVVVNAVGNAYDGDVTNAILSSLEVTAA